MRFPTPFEQVEEELAAGNHIAGFVSYECGYHFQPIGPIRLQPSDLPLLWFGVYKDPLVDDHRFDHPERRYDLPFGQTDPGKAAMQGSFFPRHLGG